MVKRYSYDVKSFRLVSMPSAQCHVDIEVNTTDDVVSKVSLVSYETEVLSLECNEDGNYTLWCSGTYSTTTARHINRFTTEFCGENMYHACKDALARALNHYGDAMVCVSTNIPAGLVYERSWGYLENTLMSEVKRFNGHY